MIHKKIFMLLALVCMTLTASATAGFDLTVGTNEHGTIAFTVNGQAAEYADEGDEVTVTITPDEGWVVNEPTGQWIAAIAAGRSQAPSIDLLKDIELSPVQGQDNQWTFTMARANAEISCTYKKVIQASWVQDISALVYTGQAQEPTVVVKDGETTLVKDVDYTVAYSNNTAAAQSTADNAPTVTITAVETSDKYTGTVTKTFTITTKVLTITAEDKEVTYGDESPTYTVSYDGFVEGEDETVLGGTLAFDCDYVKNESGVGEYTITPSGLTSNNYAITFTAGKLTVGAKALEDAFIADIADLTYTGEALEPAPVVTFNGMTLVAGTDYTVAYADNIEAGTATVTITAVADGNYSGTAQKTFTIMSCALTDITIAEIDEVTYTGLEQTPTPVLTYNGMKLVQGRDYALSYSSNVNAGQAYIFFVGLGNYTGQTQTFFIINPAELTIAADDKKATYGDEAPDYTVSYDGFVNGETEAVLDGTLAFDCEYAKGSDAGTYVVTPSGVMADNYYITFEAGKLTVEKATITAEMIQPIADVDYSGEAQVPVLTVLFNGEEIELDKDYTVSYADNVEPGTATVTVTGAGKNFTGEATATFTIRKHDATQAVIVLDKTRLTYNRQEQTVEVLKVEVDGMEVPAGDYTVSGNSATEVGEYTVTVSITKGNFVGTATTTFVIEQADLSQYDVAFADGKDIFTYSGSAYTPAVTVSDGTQTLVEGEDYELSYEDNVEVGFAKLVVTGINNYVGIVEKSFQITVCYVTENDIEVTVGDTVGEGGIPDFTVTVNGAELTLGEDFYVSFFTVEYEPVTLEQMLADPGLYIVVLTFTGNYQGSVGKVIDVNEIITIVTGINDTAKAGSQQEERWFDLKGRRLSGKPSVKGVYILNGRKVAVK